MSIQAEAGYSSWILQTASQMYASSFISHRWVDGRLTTDAARSSDTGQEVLSLPSW